MSEDRKGNLPPQLPRENVPGAYETALAPIPQGGAANVRTAQSKLMRDAVAKIINLASVVNPLTQNNSIAVGNAGIPMSIKVSGEKFLLTQSNAAPLGAGLYVKFRKNNRDISDFKIGRASCRERV